MNATAEQILDTVRRAGVIGAGGAGFPTYKKLVTQVRHVIANGAECEPLLSKDRECMIQDRAALVRGLRILQEVAGAELVTVAVKRKNEDVLEGICSQPGAEEFATLVYDDVYPAGDEYILAHEVTGQLIPPGGIPLDVGAVVDNVETLVNVAHAMDGQPVVDKYVSICGAVASPLTTIVPVGSPIGECLELAGGSTVDDPVVLTGGLMMGGVAGGLDDPVTKTMGGLIVLPADHYLVRRKKQSTETYTRIGHGQCDQCSLCTELCPRYIMGYPIEPHRVMRTLLMTGEAKQRSSLWAQYCCECNVCSYIACPEQLDPKNICVDAKQLLRDSKLGRTDEELEVLFRDPHPARRGREIPIKTLYTRLGLTAYDQKAEFRRLDWRPSRAVIPLNSHIGAPARPTVAVGDQVERGDLVADVAADQLGCPVHASIDGRVIAIQDHRIEIA